MFDCHIHTNVSTDSSMKIDEAIEKARSLNIGLVLTEHMDINFPIKDEFIFDVEKYFSMYSKYRCESLLLGVEIGMKEDCIDEARALVQKYDFDQVIGSVHLVNNKDVYRKNYYTGKTKKQAYEEYFNAMLSNLEYYNFIDTLGHIDYICRYSVYEDQEIYYSEFKEHIDLILKKLIENEKAIEINTRRLGNKWSVENITNVFKRYKELGGNLVTVGSDAHSPKDIGRGVSLAYEIAENLNLKVVYFKNRKPEYINI